MNNLYEYLLQQWDIADNDIKKLMKQRMIEKKHWENFKVLLYLRKELKKELFI